MGIDLARFRNIAMHCSEEDLHGLSGFNGLPAGQQRVKRRAQTINIGRWTKHIQIRPSACSGLM